MSTELIRRLEELRMDFASTSGESFNHFVCPILGRDEETTLCRGHILNQAFPDSARAWVVQREDVDNFYGGFFEGLFVEGLLKNNRPQSDLFSAYDAKGVIQPRLMCDGVEVGHYLYNGHCPAHHTRMKLVNNNGTFKEVVFRISPDKLDSLVEADWSFVSEADFRISAIVSLIKAAHLAMFQLRGYRYALSAAGLHVGNDILGQFFLRNRGKQKRQILLAAQDHFQPFAKMVRPIVGTLPPEVMDSSSSFPLAFCQSSSGAPFAVAVHLKTGPAMNCVLLPFAAKSFSTFIDFVRNDNDWVTLQFVNYRVEDKSWQPIGGLLRAHWGNYDFE